ncbi:alpha/beta hydrolase-fold protein [Aquimarina sp. I32.4]|uniref:alpha/beta hydrolase-fold protein n=1 Tax=Aquimarina sp. I32.4 TaxID=2053903 RepID=UPI0011AF2436|nr:alpha/beta hydrolase-fold protein [Aquimarina sp. I32.4]
MKFLHKTLYVLVICFYGVQVFSQDKIEIGEKHTLFSKTLNEEREYWVYLPPNYSDTIYAPEQYPVAYFLDGDRHFHSLTGIHDFLSKGPYASLPQMIMVGVLNTDRARDLTPTQVINKDKSMRSFPTSGGNLKFLSFLEKELIPEIQKKYRTNEYRTLIGHSFGGITVLNALLEKRDLFNAYMAIDPSIWWDDAYILKKAKEKLKSSHFKGKTLYLARADNKQKATNKFTKTYQKDIDEHLQLITQFHEVLKNNTVSKLRWGYDFYKNEDHGTISLPAEYQGLQFIYEGYQAQVKVVAANPDVLFIQYEEMSKKMGTTIHPSEALIDWIAGYCFKRKLPENAIKFLKKNTELYPKSKNTYLSLAKAYMKNENKTQAKKVLSKGIEVIDDSTKLVEQLKALK